MALKIIGVGGIFLVAFLIYVYFIPTEMKIYREIVIKATPEKLFPYINHSKKMNEWMPWVDSDPGLQMEYSGPDEGVGSKSSWNSTGKMGTGNAVILESIADRSVKTQLTYTKPMNMSQLAEMTLTLVPDGTSVRWSVGSHNGYFFRLVGVFFNMDQMVGGEFEKGLNKLKTIAEEVE